MQRTSPAATRSRAAKRVYAKPRALLNITSPRVVEERAVPTEEVPIAMEEEVPQGNVYERREFHEERTEQRPASPPLPSTLHDCISAGVLHVNLLKELDDWSPRKKDNAYVQVSALYRHILQRICNPPERIREYSLRINTLKGRDLKLKSLPRGVTDILIEMVEDMLGYGHEELEQFRQTDLQESPWYQNLGSTEQERKQNLADLKEEKKNWRPQLFKSLQLALRDVRSYSYEAGRWIANPRKRGAPGEVDENTVPCSQ
ncbi:unnamed protein product [Cylicocyclus nassatus]|uniref:Uncharacterized protein n=1 Tax=Cylicocyclus nassatus TaxID=53992 RepID=A0AA36DJN1_CYLNA|nr:unnamed protein product [Cylicocyclus nassatus]